MDVPMILAFLMVFPILLLLLSFFSYAAHWIWLAQSSLTTRQVLVGVRSTVSSYEFDLRANEQFAFWLPEVDLGTRQVGALQHSTGPKATIDNVVNIPQCGMPWWPPGWARNMLFYWAFCVMGTPIVRPSRALFFTKIYNYLIFARPVSGRTASRFSGSGNLYYSEGKCEKPMGLRSWFSGRSWFLS
jgi:hypothetical protein